MKRCPKCEFIYEEEQNHCDMDGAILVHDPRALLDTARVRSNYAHRSTRKLFVQLALPLAILATLSFYALRSQTGPHNSNPAATVGVSSSSSSIGASPSATEDANTHTLSPHNEAGVNPASPAIESDNGNQTGQADEPSAKSSPSKRQLARPQSRITPQKKENKVTSFLKKTGKFFKKPFQR